MEFRYGNLTHIEYEKVLSNFIQIYQTNKTGLDEIINMLMPIINNIIDKYKTVMLTKEDLFQEAVLIVIETIDLFDVDKAKDISNYFHLCITRRLMDRIIKLDSTVKVSKFGHEYNLGEFSNLPEIVPYEDKHVGSYSEEDVFKDVYTTDFENKLKEVIISKVGHERYMYLIEYYKKNGMTLVELGDMYNISFETVRCRRLIAMNDLVKFPQFISLADNLEGVNTDELFGFCNINQMTFDMKSNKKAFNKLLKNIDSNTLSDILWPLEIDFLNNFVYNEQGVVSIDDLVDNSGLSKVKILSELDRLYNKIKLYSKVYLGKKYL